MTATPSQSKLRPFWLNARTRIIANRKPLIVYSALQLLGLPLVFRLESLGRKTKI